MKGTKIDFNTWARTAVFRHFIDDVRCVVSLTADVDVTGLAARCKREALRFYPCFMYVVARVVNAREEFRMGYDEDGDVVVWDAVHPSYIDFHPEDEAITHLLSRYSPDFPCFYRTVVRDMDENRGKRAFEISYGERNTFDVSCLPWLHYRSLDLHVFDGGLHLAPVITWGRYAPAGGRLTMPLSIQIHHAAADGFHIARFYEDVGRELARLETLPF